MSNFYFFKLVQIATKNQSQSRQTIQAESAQYYCDGDRDKDKFQYVQLNNTRLVPVYFVFGNFHTVETWKTMEIYFLLVQIQKKKQTNAKNPQPFESIDLKGKPLPQYLGQFDTGYYVKK